ncbi:MAG: hypothetical protein KA247_02905 [Bacteroidetes bacterium]|nr:hypothetical protein [Bacteroidota bacterium]
MKATTFLILLSLCALPAYSQNVLESFDPNHTLTAEKCYDVVKTVWDGLKKISEEYQTDANQKNEFESTTEYAVRVQKNKDEYVNKIRKFFSDNKLNTRIYSVWMKADLAKYDADNQTYGLKSPTNILVQPKKNEVAISVLENKYVTLTEKNSGGYRRAYIHLNTNPEFTWFVNKQTAQEAKNNEANIFFKLSFTFDISYNESAQQINLQIVPKKLALMNQSENFTFWSEDIR